MKENNKILFLLHLPPPVHGSSIVGQLIKDSELINGSFESKYINLLISRTLVDSGKTKLKKIFRFIDSWFKLIFELIKRKPNLCYFALTTTGIAFYKDVTLVFLLRLFRVKTVFHLHNKGIKKNESNKINYILYRYVFKSSNVILLSKYLHDDIKTFVPIEQVYICSNGVEDILRNKEPIHDKKTKSRNILFLSNLIISKGVFLLVEACQILKMRGHDFTCNFVGGEGDISLDQFQKNVEKKELSNKVLYLGKKYGLDKDEIYKDTDIFVLPTNNDCFPLVLLEAMQYGLPVISTYEGGIADIVENNVTGFLIEQNNSQELADKLELLLNNEAIRMHMGKAGRAKYEKEFTLQAFESKLQGILEHLLFEENSRKHK